MAYMDEQRKIQAKYFAGKCDGIYRGKEYNFILKDGDLNFFYGIRADAKEYFKNNHIQLWGGKDGTPTNHTLSSQVACINHLFWIQEHKNAADIILKKIDPDFKAIPVIEDEGLYVDFEVNGIYKGHRPNYLKENSTVRGANNTCIDACMLAEKNGKRTLVCFEWKYRERYSKKASEIAKEPSYKTKKARYLNLLKDNASPIIFSKNEKGSKCDDNKEFAKFLAEPFYQLMRQTLLAWQITEDTNNRYGASDYINVHVIPQANLALLKAKTSPEITATSSHISEAWKTWLKQPEKHKHITPEELLSDSSKEYNLELYDYLKKRYWQ